MPFPIMGALSSIGGLAGGLGGLFGANKAAKIQQKQQRLSNLTAGTSFSPISVNAPGGYGVSFGAGNGYFNPYSGGYSGGMIGGGGYDGFPMDGGGGITGGGYFGGGGGGGLTPVPGNFAGGYVPTKDGGQQWVPGGPMMSATGGGQYGGGLTDPRTGKPMVQDLGNGFRQIGEGKNGRTFQSDIGQINLAPGAYGNSADMLGQFGQSIFGMQNPLAAYAGMGAGMYGMGADAMGGALNDVGGLQGAGGWGLGGAMGDLGNFRSNIMPGMQQGLLSAMQDAGVTGQQAYDRTLGTLREQFAPVAERGANANYQSLFNKGQMGSTGGALQTEAFAKGLGQADLDFQLAAGQEGRNATNMAMNQMTGFGNLQDSMLGNALNRFGNMMSLNNTLASNRFDMGQALNRTGGAMAMQPFGFQGDMMKLFQQSLQNSQGLYNLQESPANLALAYMNAQATARQGQAGNISQGANNMALPAANQANLWSQLGSWAGGGGLQDMWGGLQRMFGGGGGSGYDPNGMNPYNF